MKQVYSRFNNTGALIILWAAFGLFFLASSPAYAAPSNDNFNMPLTISGSQGTVLGTTDGATKQPGEPDHAANPGGVSVWYKYTSPTNGVLNLYTGGSSFNTLLAIYIGDLDSGLIRIAAGDDLDTYTSGSIWSSATVGVKAGVTYYIAVDGKDDFAGDGPARGNFQLQYDFRTAVSNDKFATPEYLSIQTGSHIWTTSNVGATKEPGEPQHLGNAGGRSVWFRYTNELSAYPRMVYLTITSANGSHNQSGVVNALIGVYTGSAVNNLTPVLTTGGNSSYTNQRITFLAQPGINYSIAIDGHNPGSGADTGTFTLTYGVGGDSRAADFDKDGIADLTVFRPSTGMWYSMDSSTRRMRAVAWGTNGDKPMLQKLEDDNSLYTIFRPQGGTWYRSRDGGGASIFNFGSNGDIPLVRSYRFSSGAVAHNAAVFRPSNGTWWIRSGSSGYAIQFGTMGDVPVLADFDNDGNDEIAVFRPSDGNWYIYNQTTEQMRVQPFGLNGDIPVVADYDADGSADIAVFRPSNGTWYVLPSRGGDVKIRQFGQAGDIPQAADYDGNGEADFAVFRNGVWWISHPYKPTQAIQWGAAGDIPVSSPMG